MKPLHRRLQELSSTRPTEDAFVPEKAAALLASVEGRSLLRALEGLSASEIALGALRALAAVRDEHERHALELELVATTPGFTSFVARDTETAVLELVDAAMHHLIVVGYELTNRPFERALHAASERGVELVIIVDRRSGHGMRIMQEWPAHLSLPRVYRERANDISSMAKMHGKALLADGARLYVSSANFTWLAMNANIEIGVLLRGEPLSAARDLFEELLIESRLLERLALADIQPPMP